MATSHDGLQSDSLSAETLLLNYTIKNLVKGNAQMMTQYGREILNFKGQLNGGERVDRAIMNKMNIFYENLRSLRKRKQISETAADEITLIQHVLLYRDILESTILQTRLQYDTLKEENEWFQGELNYFENKRFHKQQRTNHLSEKTVNFAFRYQHQRSWFDPCIPMEMYAMPHAVEFGEAPFVQIGQKISQIRSQWIAMNRRFIGWGDLINSDRENEDTLESTELNAGSKEFKRKNEPSVTLETSSGVLMGSGDAPFVNEKQLPRDTDFNASNSSRMSLSELRELLLEDSLKDVKRTREPTTIRLRSTLTRGRSSKVEKLFPEDMQLSELERETLKQCMKTLDTEIPPTMQLKLEPEVPLEIVLEQFIRSKNRTQNLATFVDLIRQFNHKETRSPGIGLCWLAINSLRRYEKELRVSERASKSSSLGRMKSGHRSALGMFEPGTWKEVEYRNVLDDLCRLLSILAHMYRSRNELTKAAQCLKELLRIRRTTRTWRQISVAQALSSLSWIQSTLREYNPALTNARKSLQLRRDLIADEASNFDQNTAELSVAKQATSLALMLMSKQQTEQKKLRYHRFTFRDFSEIPTLLNEALRIETSLLDFVENRGLPLTSDQDLSLADRSASFVGDAFLREPKTRINPIEECLLITRNALSVYYVCCRKWSRAQKQLTQSLLQLDSMQTQDTVNKMSTTMGLLKLICLKCLLHVYRVTHQTEEQNVLLDRVSKLDPFYRPSDEVNEEELIRICHLCLFRRED